MSGSDGGAQKSGGKSRSDRGISGADARFAGGRWFWCLPVNWLIMLVMLYRATISPWLPNVCRFEPSCSAYALEALKKRGLWIGTWLVFYRLLRCQPFCKAGYDPVPEKKARKAKE